MDEKERLLLLANLQKAEARAEQKGWIDADDLETGLKQDDV